ncbi:MAG: FkbM family methyltransferase [Caulobacteraceae bacterium]
MTYLDIGANVGQHALFMSRRVDRVLAFEPNPKVANRLQRNRDANRCTNLEIHRVALGLEDGDAALGSGLPSNSGSRSLAWSLDPTQNICVPIRHAGRYLSALKRADIIKLDVEGFEKTVLTAMADILRRDRPVILLELVGRDSKGGFGSEAELRTAIYPDHRLFTLGGRRHASLGTFDWKHEEAVCIPAELEARFKRLISCR